MTSFHIQGTRASAQGRSGAPFTISSQGKTLPDLGGGIFHVYLTRHREVRRATWKGLFWKQHHAVCLGPNTREDPGPVQYLDGSAQDGGSCGVTISCLEGCQ